MDSGNSGSMQSSSGGDEEYDSRAESSVPAAFLNPPTHFGSMSNHQSNVFFDLSSVNYIHAFSQSQPNSNHPNSLLHLDAVQSRGGLRSEANCTDLGNLPGSSSSAQSILGSHQGLHQGSSSTSMQLRPVGHDNGGRASAQPNVVRNSKKRTRASRRAPTTVLTTDTSNFRAMVQEFTGIPAPPFSGSSYSRRLDLFGSSSGGLRSGHLEPMGGGGLYPLRPSAQKVIQPSPFSSSSSSLNNAMGIDATNIASTTANNNFNSTLNNLGLAKQPQNMLNMQNPLLTFQPLPHPQSSSLQHPSSLNVPGFMTRSQGSLTVPISLEELGISHGHVNANLGGMPNDGSTSQDHLRSSLDGNYGNSPRVGGCKLNYSAANSSSNFSHDKALENVSARGEGTVDSWLCPSD